MDNTVVGVELRDGVVVGELIAEPGIHIAGTVGAALGGFLHALEDVQHVLRVIQHGDVGFHHAVGQQGQLAVFRLGRLAGSLVVNGDDKNTLDAIEGLDKEVITFGFDRKNDFSGGCIPLIFILRD